MSLTEITKALFANASFPDITEPSVLIQARDTLFKRQQEFLVGAIKGESTSTTVKPPGWGDTLTAEKLCEMVELLDRNNHYDPMNHSAQRHFRRYDAYVVSPSQVLSEHAADIDTDHLPVLFRALYPPEFWEAFLWGPKGEWTGLPRTEHFKTHRLGTDVTFEHRNFDGDNQFRALPIAPDGSQLALKDFHLRYHYQPNHSFGVGRYEPKSAIQFADYAIYQRYRSTFYYGEAAAEDLRMMGVLLITRANIEAVKEWLDAMKRAKFGIGVLRDSQGRFDPFGLLAEINGVEWEYDDKENAWSPKGGDAFVLPNARIREFLGMPPSVDDFEITDFFARVTEYADSLSSFTLLHKAFSRALELIEKQQKLIHQARRDRVDMGVYMGGEKLGTIASAEIEYRPRGNNW